MSGALFDSSKISHSNLLSPARFMLGFEKAIGINAFYEFRGKQVVWAIINLLNLIKHHIYLGGDW